MKEYIRKLRQSDEYYFKEGCFIIEVSNSDHDDAVSIARARVSSGGQTTWHWLSGTFERYAIMRGEGLVEIGDSKATRVTAGDVVLIPPGTRQRITNIGEMDLEFLAICTPRFSASQYYSD